MKKQDTITRSTYSAGGQAIATRVSGDPVSTNNGLFYFHSDHASASSAQALGGATFLTYGNGHTNEGQKVANSTKFYTPFGEYRIEPSSPVDEITDRGFTGHKHNDYIKLIYMGARYYLPGVGRFTSADTIVPNPYDPQSLNRFTYTRNNPLNRLDPSGHADTPYDCSGTGDGCSGPPSSGIDNERFRADTERNYYGRITRNSPMSGECASNWICSDWAGRTILSHWLFGGGEEVTINNDPRWTQYMQDHPGLQTDLENQAILDAQHMFLNGMQHMEIDESYQGWLENGEAIVGYYYLNGTNKKAGHFQRTGTAEMSVDENGNYLVDFDITYTWNDIIDPNLKYETDKWKSIFGEVLTVGGAEDYVIHIIWSESLSIQLDSNGHFLGTNE